VTKYQPTADGLTTAETPRRHAKPTVRATTACGCASPKPSATAAPVPLAEAGAHYDERAKLLKALAHPTRLYIVDCLAQRSLCVEELTGLIGGDMSTISKHLRVLKEAGVARDTRAGRRIYYSLAVPCVHSFFGCLEETLQANAAGGRR
jgi:DNA-binding transcriptional ArsR family regulator